MALESGLNTVESAGFCREKRRSTPIRITILNRTTGLRFLLGTCSDGVYSGYMEEFSGYKVDSVRYGGVRRVPPTGPR